MTEKLLTQDILRAKLEYNPLTGEFWRLPRGKKLVTDPYTHEPILVGEAASKKQLCLFGQVVNTLDILWLYHHGTRPLKQLTQIDHRWYNIRINNIRATMLPQEKRLPPEFTQAAIKALLFYDHKNGKLYWRETVKEKIQTGTTDDETGYMEISVDGAVYPATRLVWLYMTGEFPLNYIRFRNGNGWDYRWANLYESQPYKRIPLNAS